MARKSVEQILKELGPVMKSSEKTLKQAKAAQSKGTVSGTKYNTPAAPTPSRKKKSEVVRTTEQLAVGAGYLKGKGRKRTKQVKDITDQIK